MEWVERRTLSEPMTTQIVASMKRTCTHLRICVYTGINSKKTFIAKMVNLAPFQIIQFYSGEEERRNVKNLKNHFYNSFLLL